RIGFKKHSNVGGALRIYSTITQLHARRLQKLDVKLRGVTVPLHSSGCPAE
ncbi:hypothetical protein JOB18_004371, partial [Solea senegalensis]